MHGVFISIYIMYKAKKYVFFLLLLNDNIVLLY